MLRFIFSGVSCAYCFLARYAPGPRLISRIRRRDGLKWGAPAMLIAVPYFLVANTLKTLIEGGGSAWLSLPLLWCLVMGLAFVLLGPISVALLVDARLRERTSGVSLHRHAGSGGAPSTRRREADSV